MTGVAGHRSFVEHLPWIPPARLLEAAEPDIRRLHKPSAVRDRVWCTPCLFLASRYSTSASSSQPSSRWASAGPDQGRGEQRLAPPPEKRCWGARTGSVARWVDTSSTKVVRDLAERHRAMYPPPW